MRDSKFNTHCAKVLQSKFYTLGNGIISYNIRLLLAKESNGKYMKYTKTKTVLLWIILIANLPIKARNL